MKKNGFVPILIILAIAILGVVGCFAYKNYLAKSQVPIGSWVPSQSPSTQEGLFVPSGYVYKLIRVKAPFAYEMYYKTQLTNSKGQNIYFFELPFEIPGPTESGICDNYKVNDMTGCKTTVNNICDGGPYVDVSLICDDVSQKKIAKSIVLNKGYAFFSEDVNLSDSDFKSFLDGYFQKFDSYLKYR